MTDEEREAKDFWLREKYDWYGSGLLRFRIYGDKDIEERKWEESKRARLEDMLGEIVGVLVNVENEAKESRARREEREKVAEEERRLSAIEWRRQQMEEENRKRLEQVADAWARAERLRGFIQTCEAVLREGKTDLPADSWEARWLEWARQHAQRIDPLQNGFLETERRRFSTQDLRNKS